MKISLIEPLNVKQDVLDRLSEKLKQDGHTFVSYDTLSKDAEEQKARMCDSDIVMIANAREVFGLTTRNRINKGFPGHTPLFLCPEIRAVRHRMSA